MRLKELLKQSNQKTRICKKCFCEIKESSIHNLLHKNVELCHKCLMDFRPVLNEFKIGDISAINLYWYTEKIQEVLYQFKGCKDIELRNTFFEYYYDWLNFKFKDYIIIPAPSSKENDAERGFNQVIEMCSNLKMPTMCIVHKLGKDLQHNLSAKNRAKISNQMIIDDVDLSGKKILIVDDVYTTGSTVKSMIELIREKNPKKIKVLVMAKTLDLDQR